jgi:hypothetical protein
MPKANTSTSKSKAPLDLALANVPANFRVKIVKSFLDVKKRLAESNDESLGLAAGKFCESVIRLLQHEILKSFTPFGQKLPDFPGVCRKIIEGPKTPSQESIGTVMPRALVFVYTLRNKRGIGHVGGDVDANHIDAMTIARTCDWIVCELIRTFHNLSLEEAQDIVDGLAQRNLPEVWNVAGKKRVLRDGVSFKDQVLLLCYSEQEIAVFAEDLLSWVEYSNPSMFRSRVLGALHKERLIEYDRDNDQVVLSPKGIAEVETKILKPV